MTSIYPTPYTDTGVIGRVARMLVEDYAYLAVDFNNIFFPPDIQTNSVTIDECALEYNGLYVPVTFAGSGSVTMSPESVGILSDPIYPWKMGAAIFPKGAVCYIRYRATVPTGGTFGGSGDQVNTSSFYRSYNKATTVFTPIMQAGNMGLLSGSDAGVPLGDNGSGGIQPLLVGLRNSTGTAPAVMALGDSLLNGVPISFVMAAAASNGQACLEFSHGSRSQIHLSAQPAWTHYLRYVSELIDEMGTNALIVPGSEVLAESSYWATAKNTYGISGIYNAGLYPRSTNSNGDSFASVSGQNASFAGSVDAYDSYMDSKVADGTLRGRFRTLSIRSSPTSKLWIADGTPNKYTQDGIHATTLSNSMVAAEFAPVFAGWMAGRLAPAT